MNAAAIIPVGTRVMLVQTGWCGTVVRHVPTAFEDRANEETSYIVRWERNGQESWVRSARRLRVLSEES